MDKFKNYFRDNKKLPDNVENRLEEAEKLYEGAPVTKDSTAFDRMKPEDKYIRGMTTSKSGEVNKDELTVKGKLALMLQTRAIKRSSSDSFTKIANAVISDMDSKITLRNLKTSILLRSEPGSGKTSIVKKLSRLLGLPIFTIEAPHVSKENLINIPFIITKDFFEQNFTTTVGEMTEDDKDEKTDVVINGKSLDLKIVKAETNLVTMIKRFKNLKKTDEQWEKNWKKDSQMRTFMENPAFNAKEKIQRIRSSYFCILFIDEYFRTENVTVRNILRNILNGRIGNDLIPEGTYTIFATNDTGEGVQKSFKNEEFQSIDVDKPSADDTYNFMQSFYGYEEPKEDEFNEQTPEEKQASEDSAKEEIKSVIGKEIEEERKAREEKEARETESKTWAETETEEDYVENQFTQRQKDMDELFKVNSSKQSFDAVNLAVKNFCKKYSDSKGRMNLKGEETDVSPRRLTEMIGYLTVNIGPSLDKAEDKELALRNIYTFIKRNFYNYMGKYNGGYDMEKINSFVESINEAIINVNPNMTTVISKVKSSGDIFLKPSEWQEALDHEFETQFKMGSLKAYTPVLAGIPGLGKTSVINAIAKRHQPQMGIIAIDCSSLDKDSASGMPSMKVNQKDKAMEVEFTESNLFLDMISQINRQIELWRVTNPNWKREDQRYNFIMFFDEFNRVEKTSTFNAIRKVFLDKTFSNPKYFIPKDVMLMAAINPEDTGVIDMTEHLKDVVNVIESKPSWSKTKQYLLERYKKGSVVEDKSEIVPEGLGGSSSKFPSVTLNTVFEKNIASTKILGATVDENGNSLGEDERPFYFEAHPSAEAQEFVYYMSPRSIDNWLRKVLYEISDMFKTADLSTSSAFDSKDVEELCKIIATQILPDEVNVLPHWVDAIKKYANDQDEAKDIEPAINDLQMRMSSAENQKAYQEAFVTSSAKGDDFETLFETFLVDDLTGSAIQKSYDMVKKDEMPIAYDSLVAYFNKQTDMAEFMSEFSRLYSKYIAVPYLDEKASKYVSKVVNEAAPTGNVLDVTFATKLYFQFFYSVIKMLSVIGQDADTIAKKGKAWEQDFIKNLKENQLAGFKQLCMSIFKSREDQIYKLIDDPEEDIELLKTLKEEILAI